MISIITNIAGNSKIRRIRAFFGDLIKIFIGAVFCQNPLTAPLVMGWISHYMRIKSVQVWVKESSLEKPSDFYETKGAEYSPKLPNWFRLNNAENGKKKSRLLSILRKYLGSIWTNYKMGLKAFFSVWLLSIPFCLIWLLMWWAGGDMAYNNSYEEIYFAPIASLISVFLFAFLMMFLPIAQARQALHQDWTSLFDFKTIAIIIRYARIRLFFMALIFTAMSFGIVLGTKMIPTFFEDVYAIDVSNSDGLREIVKQHYMRVALLFFMALLILKRMSARIYAFALLGAVRAHALKPEQLTALENELLFKKLNHTIEDQPQRASILSPELPKSVRGFLQCLNNTCFFLMTLAVWVVFVFSIYVGQFFNIHMLDWLNHPLIHMPYIRVP